MVARVAVHLLILSSLCFPWMVEQPACSLLEFSAPFQEFAQPFFPRSGFMVVEERNICESKVRGPSRGIGKAPGL